MRSLWERFTIWFRAIIWAPAKVVFARMAFDFSEWRRRHRHGIWRTGLVNLGRDEDEPLEGLYVPVTENLTADRFFDRLRFKIYQALVSGSGTLSNTRAFFEYGVLSGGRTYFFIKPLSDVGFLFERSGYGWILSRSEKIVGKNLFMRKGDVEDQVLLFQHQRDRSRVRIESRMVGDGVVSYRFYEKQIITQIIAAVDEGIAAQPAPGNVAASEA